jgi:histidinol phosphatase-like enzyme (inositol monophosphatase family)
MKLQEFAQFAQFLANQTTEIARKYYRKTNGEIQKEDESPVTKADREIEKKIREEIEKKYPSHGIIGEEYGKINEDSDFQWILDPIDGTSSFIIGRPLFGTLIALSYKGEVVVGLMNQPIINERWLGIKGQGAFFNDKKIKTRNCQEISDSIICSSSSFHFHNDDQEILKKLTSKAKYQKIGGIIYGGDCYSYASLASGFIDIVFDPGLQIYDYAALLPIITEAGGIVSDWQGNDLRLKSNVKLIACGNKELHKKALEIINS